MPAKELPITAIDDLLTYMTTANVQNKFAGALPLMPSFFDAMKDVSFFADAPRDAVDTFDVRVVEAGGDPGIKYLAQRFQSKPKAVNKSLRFPLHWDLIGVSRAFLHERGTVLVASEETWAWTKKRGYFLALRDGKSGDLVDGGRRILYGDTRTTLANLSDDGFSTAFRHVATADQNACLGATLSIGISLELSLRYEWAVTLGYFGCGSVLLPTDPTGIYELFRLRDLEPGQMRRSSLIHWVQEHFRKRRNSPEKTIKVKEHIRGKTNLSWGGFNVSIRPPKFDLERLAQSGNKKAQAILAGA